MNYFCFKNLNKYAEGFLHCEIASTNNWTIQYNEMSKINNLKS